MGLAALRQAAELTQVELARRLGVTQAAISRLEQPHDLLLSTLNSHLQSIGGTARMIVSFADGTKPPSTSANWHNRLNAGLDPEGTTGASRASVSPAGITKRVGIFGRT